MRIGVRPDDQTKLYEEIEKLTGWERPQTNKEWIQSATTEQLAEFLADKCNEVADFILHEADEHGEDFDQDEYWYRQDAFVEWLKQPHKPKE